MNNKRLIVNIVEIILGLILVVCASADLLDEFWSGMGAALIVVGALQSVRHIKYKTNAEYKQNIDIQVNDERNKYISMKAWSWAGYLFVLIAAVSAIVAKILGQDALTSLFCGCVCVILVLYWLAYLVLRRKY